MAKPGFLDYHRVSNLWQTCFLIFTFLTIAANVSAGPGPGPGPGPEDIDYRTEGLATAPGGLTAGQLVTFSATVKNYGGDPEGIPSQTRLRLDIDNNGTWDFTPADQTTGGLTSVGSANDSEVETWSSVWTATAGTHLFEVCADVELIITETNEGNNCTTQTFTVLPAVTYNLTVNSSGASSVVITSSSGHGGTTNYTRSALAAGANVSLTAPATSGGNNYSSWSGCDSVLGNTCSVSMNAAKTVTVTYTPPAQPDYIAEGLATAPGGLTAGQSVTFAATVRNSGAGAASVSSQTNLRLDIDNNGSWDFTPVDQTTGALAAGATEVENWSNAWTAQVGTHLFEVCADAGSAIAETNEGSNCATQTFTVLPAVTYYNLTVNSSGASSVVITSSSGHGGTTNYTRSALAAGANVSLTAPATSGGNNYAGWSGCDSVLAETCSVSMNAAKTVTVTYTPPAQPDYITEGLGVSPGGLTAGQSVTFAATVRNSGAGVASASSQTRLRLDIDNNGTWDFTPADQTTGALAAASSPGDTEVENWSNAWTAQVGTHLFEVCADAGSAIAETNEGNNCTTQIFSVGVAPTPDLTVGPSITVNGTLIAGMPLTFTNSGVNNSGTAPAGASTARFCIDNSNCLTSSTGQVNAPSIGALATGANSGSITSSSWTATIGPHTVYFCADVFPVPPPGAVTESNENNNCAGAGTSFTIGAAFDFTLSNNGDVSITQGLNTSRTINASLDSGATQSVAFSVTSAPISGVSFSFAPSPASCSPACSKTLNISTSGSTPAGAYPVTVTGTSVALTKTTQFTLTILQQTLLISSLNIVPNPADPGISRNITATRDPSSTALGMINYSFWWNCNNASANVSTVSADSSCGSLPADAAGGGCTVGSNGAKCNGENATSMMVSRAYSARSTAKVIMEQGPAPSAERRTTVNVNLDATCTAVPAIASVVDDTVRWTAFPTGGSGSYTFTWSGSSPLGGRTGNPVDVVYTLSGQKNGSVTVNDGFTSDGPNTCTNSPITITGRFLTFDVNPTPINAGQSTVVRWRTEEFPLNSCTLNDNNPDTAINGGLVSNNCGIAGSPACPAVNLAITTIFTLTCDGISRNATAQVRPPPSFIEIPPP